MHVIHGIEILAEPKWIVTTIPVFKLTWGSVIHVMGSGMNLVFPMSAGSSSKVNRIPRREEMEDLAFKNIRAPLAIALQPKH